MNASTLRATNIRFIRRGVLIFTELVLLLALMFWASIPVYATQDMDPLWRDFYYDLRVDNLLYLDYGCMVCHGGVDTDSDGVIDNVDAKGGTALNLYGLDLNQYAPGLLNLKDLTDADMNGTPDTWDTFTDYLLWIEPHDPDADGGIHICDNYTEINTSFVVTSHPGIYNPYTCSLIDTDECGIPDVQDNCPYHCNPSQEDLDKDGIGDACDVDADGDGYQGPLGDNTDCDDFNKEVNPGAREICGNAVDENCDGIPEPGSGDMDKDGVMDCNDNCPFLANPYQWDSDCDGIGDECDATPCGNDPDGDCRCNDNCPEVYNPDQRDRDGDGVGDVCDCDADGDGYEGDIVKIGMYETIICGGSGQDCNDLNANINPGRMEDCRNWYDDNCDGYLCPVIEQDPDYDGIPNHEDNCPYVYNPLQEDSDGDGVGDLCADCGTDCDGDGLANISDPKPWMVPDGDVNRDGMVNLPDLMLALRIASGELVPDPLLGHMADCVPYLSTGGAPDNVVDLYDIHYISTMIGMGR